MGQTIARGARAGLDAGTDHGVHDLARLPAADRDGPSARHHDIEVRAPDHARASRNPRAPCSWRSIASSLLLAQLA